MAHLKEPKGVDFIIESEPLTEEARAEISAFIKAYKAKKARRPLGKKSNNSSRKKATGAS